MDSRPISQIFDLKQHNEKYFIIIIWVHIEISVIENFGKLEHNVKL